MCFGPTDPAYFNTIVTTPRTWVCVRMAFAFLDSASSCGHATRGAHSPVHAFAGLEVTELTAATVYRKRRSPCRDRAHTRGRGARYHGFGHARRHRA